jgi:CO/xanthine dehydrogenase FAD-binding subunit
MIVEYNRPQSIEEALDLLGHPEKRVYPLGGGTVLSCHSEPGSSVVDLQGLGLDKVSKDGSEIQLGATCTLQKLLNDPLVPSGLKPLIKKETNINLRQTATLAGALISADGRSTLGMAMLALDATMIWLPGKVKVSYGDWLSIRGRRKDGLLISGITIPGNVKLLFEFVSRTPEDLPIVCAALAQWPSGRTRVALGGYGSAPIMAFDGPDSLGTKSAVMNAYIHAEDNKASGEYRSKIAGILVQRLLNLDS